MPITKSAKKAVKVTKRRTAENLITKFEIKNKVKGLRLVVLAKKGDVSAELAEAYRALDKAAKKNFIHKNKASRLKSRLATAALKAGSKIDKKIKESKPVKTIAPKNPKKTSARKATTKAKPKTTKK